MSRLAERRRRQYRKGVYFYFFHKSSVYILCAAGLKAPTE